MRQPAVAVPRPPGAQAPRLRRALLLRRQERRARRPGERRCRLRARARAPCPTQATVQAAQARKQVPCSTRGRAARSGRARASWRPLSSSASRCACRRCSAGPSAPATRATSPSASTAAPATRASASPLSWHSAGSAERTTCARALCNPPLWRWRASKLCASPCRFVRIAQHAQWEQPGPRQARVLHQAARQQSRSPPRQARGAVIARLVRTQGAAAGLARSVRACRARGPEQPRVSGRAERPRRARRGAGRARACCSGRHGTSAPASAAAQARCAGAGRTASSQASASSGPASSSQLPAKRTAATRSCAGGGAEC